MSKGLDGSHDYRAGVKIQNSDSPNSSSSGPMPAGPMHEEQTQSPVPDASSFSNAHSMTRGGGFNEWGSYTGPTTPGTLGSSTMFPTPGPLSYDPGSPTMVTHVGDRPTDAAYKWPDAPGGGLGHNPDGYER